VLGIEATVDVEERWGRVVEEAAANTLYDLANTWYNGRNIDGKKGGFTPYAGGYGTYRRICDAVAAGGYDGFELFADR
jgi:cyclohexanone monooxygenase